ncbi:unnamed protein product [Linum trigynum]|uniref:Uncharacterized protein n=1 Tax=Linum trigynum TaxID=586398 RepID=A0AAV2CUB9_9ROSI
MIDDELLGLDKLTYEVVIEHKMLHLRVKHGVGTEVDRPHVVREENQGTQKWWPQLGEKIEDQADLREWRE